MQSKSQCNRRWGRLLCAILVPIVILLIMLAMITVEAKAEVVIDINILKELENNQISINTIDINVLKELASAQVSTNMVSINSMQKLDNMEVKEQEITASGINPYTREDVNLLAKIMYAEEGVFFGQYYATEPEKVEETFKLAGSVVLNRQKYHYMDAITIKDVLYSKGQYANATIRNVNSNQDIPDLVYVWAEDLLKTGPIGPEGLVYQAQFIQGDMVYKHNWNQYFCVSNQFTQF